MSRKEKKQKDEKQNPYHKEYGLWSNGRYVLGALWKDAKGVYLILVAETLTMTFSRYVWNFLSRYVIDSAMGKYDQTAAKFFGIVAAICMAVFVTSIIQSFANSEKYWRLIRTRIRLLGKKNRKSMEMDFYHLEDTDLLDCLWKASNACSGNVNGIEGLISGFLNFITNLVMVLAGIAIISTLNPLIAVILIVLSILSSLFGNYTNKVTKKKVWDMLAPWWRKNNYMQHISTDFSAAKDIRMFHLKDWLLEKQKVLNKERLASQALNERLWFVNGLVGTILWNLGMACVYGWLLWEVIKGNMTVGNFSLYLGTSAVFSESINSITSSISGLMARSREVDDFRSFMDINGGESEGIPVPKYEKYEFVFENVSFKYPRAEKYALKNMNITIKGGERLAVVGLNGAGKSTFIKLMLRLYKPTEGRILLNGTDIQVFDRESYYEIFAPLFQDVALFAFPMSENVSMRLPEETDKQKAQECLEEAGLREKVAALPNGVETQLLKIIYDDGVDLSGGEKQKLALARALYKNSPVVVLDEPTAALDAIAESKLYQDFDKLIGGKTAVYISHRLSSTQFCNNVAMFKGGEMIEYGTHESLLKADGEYAKMWHIQSQYYVESEEETVNE